MKLAKVQYQRTKAHKKEKKKRFRNINIARHQRIALRKKNVKRKKMVASSREREKMVATKEPTESGRMKQKERENKLEENGRDRKKRL